MHARFGLRSILGTILVLAAVTVAYVVTGEVGIALAALVGAAIGYLVRMTTEERP